MPTRQETQARQQQVMALTARGWSAPRIGAHLGVSKRTVYRARAQFREDRISLDCESILDMLVVQLDRARHIPDTLVVYDRIIRLTSADQRQQGDRIPELLAAIKGALREGPEW